jgi:hypothetical protein
VVAFDDAMVGRFCRKSGKNQGQKVSERGTGYNGAFKIDFLGNFQRGVLVS